jgi:hypothetical protein
MKRKSRLIIPLLLASITLLSAQNLRLPRDPDKLIDRAQRFWAAMAASQRTKALDFVLPEKKDTFLSGTSVPIVKAKVLGLDLTSNADQATVRVAIDILSGESASGFMNWTVSDTWIWKEGNWYLNVAANAGMFHAGPAPPAVNTKEVQKAIETNFQLLRHEIDLGTLVQGQYPPPVEIPIKYTGDLQLSLEVGLPNPVVSLAVISDTITSDTKNVVLQVSTENWDGPFTFPLPLKIRSGGAVVERLLVVKGSVFVPLVFRQSPADGPVPGQEFSIFIRNNTDERAPIGPVVVDGKMDLLKKPEALLPHEEVELVFKTRPDETPDRLYLVLTSPIQGRSNYTYIIRTVRQ